jgi:hypothetical protein
MMANRVPYPSSDGLHHVSPRLLLRYCIRIFGYTNNATGQNSSYTILRLVVQSLAIRGILFAELVSFVAPLLVDGGKASKGQTH